MLVLCVSVLPSPTAERHFLHSLQQSFVRTMPDLETFLSFSSRSLPSPRPCSSSVLVWQCYVTLRTAHPLPLASTQQDRRCFLLSAVFFLFLPLADHREWKPNVSHAVLFPGGQRDLTPRYGIFTTDFEADSTRI